jgi:hypothetical protein
MIATHAGEVARLVAEHACSADASGRAREKIAEISRGNEGVLTHIGDERGHGVRSRTPEPSTQG